MDTGSKEQQRIRASDKGEDLDELNQEQLIDNPLGQLRDEDVQRFWRVTDDMLTVLEAKDPEAEVDTNLDPTLRFALEALFEARTARNIETWDFISAIERSKLLNQALMHLQPVLATALRPDFKEGRAKYDRLVESVNQLRSEISQAIMAQIMKRKKRPKIKDDKDEGEDDTDAADDADDADEPGKRESIWSPPDDDDDEGEDGEGEGDRAAGESGLRKLARRFFGRGKKPADESGDAD